MQPLLHISKTIGRKWNVFDAVESSKIVQNLFSFASFKPNHSDGQTGPLDLNEWINEWGKNIKSNKNHH